MAALTRRGWSDILTEVLRRAGGINYSGFSARAQQLISAAYYDICSLYRHVELELVAVFDTVQYDLEITITAVGAMTPDVSGVVYHVHSLYERAFNNPPAHFYPAQLLTRVDRAALLSQFSVTAAQPQFYAIYGNVAGEITVGFNCPADISRGYVIVLQQLPERPDFTTTDVPGIGQQWDEHLIELSLSKIGAACGDQQLAAVNAALFRDFVSQSGQVLIQGTQGASTPDAAITHRMSTGKVP